MKLINPSVKLYEQESFDLEGIYKQIEKCARVSYKSEDKITETSSKAFVDNLIKAGHYAPLEFGTVYLEREVNYRDFSYNIFETFYEQNPYSKVDYENGYCLVTTNYRVIVENNLTRDLKYICNPCKYHQKRYCVKFITDIGTAREFTRHRVFSFMQESTRYCNYTKGKFNNEITCIIPSWSKLDWRNSYDLDIAEICNESENINLVDQCFLISCCQAEKQYTIAIKAGAKPQEARQILPLATKTELLMCGFEDDWKHFFDLRLRGTTGAPHPDAKYLAQETWNLFKDSYDVEL